MNAPVPNSGDEAGEAPCDELAPDDETVCDAPAADLQRFAVVVDEATAGKRLDALLASAVSSVSRSRIRRSIDAGLTQVNGLPQKASYRVSAGERIELVVAPALAGPQPDPRPLDVLFEDETIVVINKPPGMVVHPAKGHWTGTLAGALVHRFENLSGVGGPARPGIVHRLDRDTSGAIVVAKTDAAHEALARQFHDREVHKEYLAIVTGSPDRDADRVDAAIGPHPSIREKMSIRTNHPDSRPAETFFEVVERYPGFALMRAHPKTGRTHQVRLHLAYLRCPVLCDRLYGSRAKITIGELRTITRRRYLAPELSEGSVLLGRQALHAHRLSFSHPTSAEPMAFEAPVASDMQQLISILRQTAEVR